MKVMLIEKTKELYKNALQQGVVKPDSLFRRCIIQWKKHFTLDEMRMEGILDLALKNKESGRYWGGENHSIKSGLKMLAKHNPDLFWEAMQDLLNEDRMLIMRVNRFIHHCDVIFADYRKLDQKVNTHFQNYYSASLLLSLEHPESYCLYDYPLFNRFCKNIGVNNTPIETDLERYYKIIRSVYTIVSKDESFMNLYYSNLEIDVYLAHSLEVIHNMMTYSVHGKTL